MIKRRKRSEDNDNENTLKATLINLKFETNYVENKENVQSPAKKRIKLEPNANLPLNSQPSICIQSVPHILRASATNFSKFQRSRGRQRQRNSITTMETRLENKKNEALVDKQKSLECFLACLTDKLLTTSKCAVLSEESIKELLVNNKNVVQNLTQIELIHLLQTNGFAKGKNCSDMFEFSEAKISKFMEQRQLQLISATVHNSFDAKDFIPKRELDLNVLVKLLIDRKLLTDKNTVVRKQTVRTVFQQQHDLMPNLKHSELGRWLCSFGFVEHKKDPPGTFTFVPGKVFKLQLELLVENVYKMTQKLADQMDTCIKKIGSIKTNLADSEDEDEVIVEPLYLDHCITIKRTTHHTALVESSKYSCLVCQQIFLLESTMLTHNAEFHGLSFTMPRHLKQYSCETRVLKLTLVPNKRKKNLMGQPEKIFTLRNTHSTAVSITKIIHYHMKANNSIELINKAGQPISKVEAGETTDFIVNNSFDSSLGIWHSILIFVVDDANFEFIEHFYVKDSNVYASKRNPLHPQKMDIYAPSDEIIKLFNCAFEFTPDLTQKEMSTMLDVKTLLLKDPKTRLTEGNYVTALTYGIQIADCAEEKQLREFDMKSQVIRERRPGRFGIEITAENRIPPDLAEKDSVLLSKEGAKSDIEARVDKILSNFVYIRPRCSPAWFKDAKIDVKFLQNRISVRMENKAVNLVQQQNLVGFMFPKTVPDKTVEITDFEWFNKSIANNPYQKQAVTMVVNGTAFPAPYIIYGPPGTGKTSTIVETVCQLWKKPTNHILVTAQSNAAANEVGERLLKYLPQKDVYRLFSRSSEEKIKDIDEKLLKASNLDTRRHQYPDWSEFYEYRVIICTLCTSGLLQLAGIDTHHFTHVFIDECGSSTESSSLIAIAGIITSKERINGHIILAGDIKQLGPVVKSKMAANLGYAKPLMERLMETPIYQKDPTTQAHNPRMITKLLYNFRSHEKIIEFSNKTFYDGDLLVKGLPESTNWALNWCHLPNKNFPIIFHPSYSDSCQEKQNPSLFNMKEIDIVEKYIALMLTFGINQRSIKQTDIGIISPYRRQCQKMVKRFGDNKWPDIEIGTVETFQGREKPIIFLTTVRSGGRHVGFLNNPRRLNVSVTRAKALMIIVGNPKTLKNDANWYDLIKYCQTNGGCITPVRLGLRPEPADSSASNIEDMRAEFAQLEERTKNQKITAKDFM